MNKGELIAGMAEESGVSKADTEKVLNAFLSQVEKALCAGDKVQLTRNEARILQRLMAEPGRIVSRTALMDALWQTDAFVDDNTLTVNVARLRRRLEGLGLTGALATRRGQGYQLCL